MKYLFNGKNLTIPDNEIERSMQGLKISKDEAIRMWLEDNDYLINKEQQALIEKTKGMKINHEAKSNKPKAKRTRSVKIDETKVTVINLLEKTLKENGYENVAIENSQKIITFNVNDEKFTINLIKQRKKKD